MIAALRRTLPFLICLTGTPVLADHPVFTFGTEASGPITTIPAQQLARGEAVVGLRTDTVNTDAASDEMLKDLAARGVEGVHSIDRLTSTSMALAYGVSDDLMVGARLPYVKRSNIREGEAEAGLSEVHSKGDAASLGDITFFGQYRFSRNGGRSAAVLFGLKAPTGKTDVTQGGERLDTELQPGSGSWDALAGVALSQSHGRAGYHFNVLYNKTTPGAQNTRLGDAVFYNAAVTWRLADIGEGGHPHRDGAEHRHPAWDLMLELNGERRGRDKVAGDPQPNSGGDVVYLSPGIRLSADSDWSGFLAIGIPIRNDRNGEQIEIRQRLVGGIAWRL